MSTTGQLSSPSSSCSPASKRSAASGVTPSESASAKDISTRHAQMAALNPSLDRSRARVHRPDTSKLTIVFNHPPPKPPSRVHYSHPVDWSGSSSVAALNHWRTNRFYYWFGTPQARRRKVYTEDEEEWILREEKEKGYRSWEEIAQKFNQTFRAQAQDDDDEERPKLSGSTIRAKAECLLTKTMSGKAKRVPRKRNFERKTADEAHDAMDYLSEVEEGEVTEERRMKQEGRLRPWEL